MKGIEGELMHAVKKAMAQKETVTHCKLPKKLLLSHLRDMNPQTAVDPAAGQAHKESLHS